MLTFIVWCVCNLAVRFSRFAEWLVDTLVPVNYGPRVRSCCQENPRHLGVCVDGMYHPMESTEREAEVRKNIEMLATRCRSTMTVEELRSYGK